LDSAQEVEQTPPHQKILLRVGCLQGIEEGKMRGKHLRTTNVRGKKKNYQRLTLLRVSKERGARGKKPLGWATGKD